MPAACERRPHKPLSGADIYSFAELWRQYRACRANKRSTVNALAFELDVEAKLLELERDLRSHRYRPGRAICFVTDGPKPREVFAADFRDRVVHHLLVSWQEPVFERRFIHDSYACRAGKGTLAASDRLMQFLRKVTANGHRRAWALKLDVASFFPSIHKRTLYEIIARQIHDPEILWLTRVLLLHDPTSSYRFRAAGRRVARPGRPGYPVPPEKSLFGKRNERGLPIGNLTSQFWGNVYLDELDQYVKRKLRCRYYIRYVDDMVFLSEDRAELLAWREAAAEFLRDRLKLGLRRSARELFPVAAGIDFIGWRTWWNRRLPRRRTVGSLRGKLERFERRRVRSTFGGLALRVDLSISHADGAEQQSCAQPGKWCRRSTPHAHVDFNGLRATVASYAGHLCHGASWGDWERVWKAYPWLASLFERRGWRITPRWPGQGLDTACRFGDQYRRLTRRAGERCLVFWPAGCFVEFHGPQRLLAEQVLGLKRVWLPRADYAFTVGFPVWLASRFARRALLAGMAVVIIRREAAARHGYGYVEWRRMAVLHPALPS